MTVKTDKGNFGGFYSVYRFMLDESLDHIKILGVDWWSGAASLDFRRCNDYSINEIYKLYKGDF